MAEIVLDHVVKRYPDGALAVDDFNLTIADGEFIILVGPSGCGKSTTLNMVAGLEDITQGDLRIDGTVVNDKAPKDRDIAMVFQSYALYPHMTVRDNLAFGLKLRKTPKDQIDKRVQEAAAMLSLENLLNRKPRELSGGQRQRVAMGRAIVRQPKAFLFDEPLSNLDALLRAEMRIEIKKLHQRLRNTVVYVTHDQVEAMTLADRIVVLKDGRVEQVGTPMELYHHPGNLFVAQFIGSPAMNIVPATIERAGATTAIAIDGGLKADVPVATPPDAKGGAISFGVRPEDLRIATGDTVLFEGRVDYIEQLGEVQLVYLDIGRADAPLVVKLPGNTTVKRGESLKVDADPGTLHIFNADGRSFAREQTTAKAA